MRNRKRILLVSHELTYTGAPRSLLNLAVLLKKNGHYVEVWSLLNGELRKEFIEKNIKVRIFDGDSMDESEIAKFDTVILNTIFTAHLLRWMPDCIKKILYIREAQNIPIIVHDCGIDDRYVGMADEVICVSEYAEKFIKKTYNLQNLKVIHNFVNDDYRCKLNIVRNRVINFIISGTYEYRKGQDIVIKAFKSMPEDLKKITRLHIVGPKPEWGRDYWQSVQKEYDYRIIEHGEISDRGKLLKLYEEMNVFVIASRDEACSLVALEGAMLGKALIMSENVGAQYLDKKRQYIYQTQDIDTLCRNMCRLTSRKELIFQGIEMRKMYKKTSTEKVFTKEFLKLVLGE